jgi:hypothetical protein
MKDSIQHPYPNPIVIILALLAAGVVAVMAQSYVKVDHLAKAVKAPQVLTIGTSVTLVFTNNESTTEGRIIVRTLQNTGTVPLLYAINQSDVTTASYHGVIAPGSVARDGLGSIVDFSHIPYRVAVKTESSSTTVALVDITQ